MQSFRQSTISRSNEGDIFYLDGGPIDGSLLVFAHGWPGAPETWKPQLETFASLGFRVVAPAMRGYHRSVVPTDTSEYAMVKVVGDLRALIHHLGYERAVWVGHDWGCGPVWALASHHPELCAGIINLCIPYRTLEFGLKKGLLPHINRQIYPADEYPHGPWDYQRFYETNFQDAVAEFDTGLKAIVKALYRAGGRAPIGTPSPTATVSQRGGWFGKDGPPDVPLESTVLDAELYETVCEHLSATGMFGACAWYMNHGANEAYAETSVDGGVLAMPVLFIEAKNDVVCDTAVSTLANPMRAMCKNLTQCSVEGGHWVALEKPREVNAAIARWLATSVTSSWPGYWRTPFVEGL